jgi:hypothetical protein
MIARSFSKTIVVRPARISGAEVGFPSKREFRQVSNSRDRFAR